MKNLKTVRTIEPRDKNWLRRLKQIIHGLVPSAVIFLYGSAARGARGPESDYDILILTDTPLPTKQQDAVRDAIYELELSNEVVISIIFYTKDEWNTPLARAMPFHKRVEKEAVLL